MNCMNSMDKYLGALQFAVDQSQNEKFYRKEVSLLKLYYIFDIITLVLTIISVLGVFLLIGSMDNLFVAGMIIGGLMFIAPLFWFFWLDSLGWYSERFAKKIQNAKRNRYCVKCYSKGIKYLEEGTNPSKEFSCWR